MTPDARSVVYTYWTEQANLYVIEASNPMAMIGRGAGNSLGESDLTGCTGQEYDVIQEEQEKAMRKLLFTGFAAAALLLGPEVGLACGDKFRGSGPRDALGRVPPGEVPRVDPDLHESGLEHAGGCQAVQAGANIESGRPQASSRRERRRPRAGLARASTTSSWRTIADTPSVQKDARWEASKPSVVPVLYKPTPAELAAVEKKYGCLIAPARAAARSSCRCSIRRCRVGPRASAPAVRRGPSASRAGESP
jgi:hypothetical protein